VNINQIKANYTQFNRWGFTL